MSNAINPEKAMEQQIEGQRQLTKEQQERQAAMEMMGNPEMFSNLRDHRFLEVLGDPDISTDDIEDDLDQEVTTELSRLHMLANIPREYWERSVTLNPTLGETLKCEHPRQRGPSSKCRGEVREIMAGEEDPRPPLTPDLARRYDNVVDVRNKLESLGIDGKAFDGIVKLHGVLENRSPEQDGGSGGTTLGRLKKVLPGGGG